MDVSLVDSMVSALEIINMIYLCTGRIPERIGNRYEAIYPYDSFEARDGMVIIACGNDKLYGVLKSVLEMPELEDEKYDANVKRIEHHEELKELIEQWTKVRTVNEVVDTLLAAGVPAGPINSIDKVVVDPHIAGAREMFVDLPHPVAGPMKVTGSQLKFTNKKIQIDRPAPMLGQHTEEILKEKFGISHEEYEKLKDENAF